MKTVEELETLIRESMDAVGFDREGTGKFGADLGMDDLDVVDLILDLEERLEIGVVIDMPEEQILKMSVVEFAVALKGYLETQEG